MRRSPTSGGGDSRSGLCPEDDVNQDRITKDVKGWWTNLGYHKQRDRFRRGMWDRIRKRLTKRDLASLQQTIRLHESLQSDRQINGYLLCQTKPLQLRHYLTLTSSSALALPLTFRPLRRRFPQSREGHFSSALDLVVVRPLLTRCQRSRLGAVVHQGGVRFVAVQRSGDNGIMFYTMS